MAPSPVPRAFAMFTLRLLGGASLDGPDGPVAGRAALRQRVALLALLAVEHPRPLSRDKLLALLWPESGTADARHLLRESLYIIRSALGEHAVLSTGDDLRLNPDGLACDLWQLEASLGLDDLEGALGLYHGPFLDGFHLSGAEEFERWAEGERAHLARRYASALEQAAERRMQAGDPVRAVEWWSRLARDDPYNSRIALRYMQALDAAGDRAAACRHAAAHSELLRTELGAAPEAEVLAFAERLRTESRVASAETPRRDPPIAAAATTGELGDQRPVPVLSTPEPIRPSRRGWLVPLVLTAGVVVGVGVLGGKLSRARPPELAPSRIAAVPFENRTGRPDLDDLGAMAADWIIRGVLEMPLVDLTELEAVYAGGRDIARGLANSLASARHERAAIVVQGSYYLAGDSVLFQASAMDVASGRVLRSFDPVGARLDRATAALELLRERIAVGVRPLIDPIPGADFPVDPGLGPPPNLAAYREFLAGLQDDDWERYRHAARLDTTFVEPLVQLAFSAVWADQCAITDSVGTVLDGRRDRLTPWNRITIDLLRARCQGDRTNELRLLRERHLAYPRSILAQATYAAVGLQSSNQPRAALEILRRLDPDHRGAQVLPDDARAWYWWRVGALRHSLGEYRAELEITDRWHDSSASDWYVIRGRALGALGRRREVMELVERMSRASAEPGADRQLRLAAELAAHGQSDAARTIAERLAARLAPSLAAEPTDAAAFARVHGLLGDTAAERDALERVVRSDADTAPRLEAEARLAVLSADSVRAEKIDSSLAEQAGRRLREPSLRAQLMLARAQLAAGFGRRERAVELLHEARSRGWFRLGSAHVYHTDPLLAPLRGYPPFEALLRPDD